jgi:hypothetical protein
MSEAEETWEEFKLIQATYPSLVLVFGSFGEWEWEWEFGAGSLEEDWHKEFHN